MEPNVSWLRRSGAAWLQAGAIVAACGIATFAGISSWTHGVEVAKSVGEPNAPIVPATVDGMMIAGTLLAAYARLRGFRPGAWTNFCLWAGGLMTIGFNVLSALDRHYANAYALGKGVFVASMSAVALIATVEAIFHPGTKRLIEDAVSAVATAVEYVSKKAIVESAPVAPPEATPVAQPVPVKKAAPPAGKRGRPSGTKSGNRPPFQAKQAQGTRPQQTRPMVVDAVVIEKTPEPVATETAEISSR